jgi:hypothetical protein
MLLVLSALLYVSVAVSLKGRWMKDGSLGIYSITPVAEAEGVYKVENELWRRQSWHYATLRQVGSNVTLEVHETGEILGGLLWPAEGTHFSWNNGTAWHLYGSDVTCYQETKKRSYGFPELFFNGSESGHRSPPEETIEPRTDVSQVHVVFMTHFDLGYNDYAWCIMSHYFWRIYPGIIQTSLVDPYFIYTTHPWILYVYFNCERLQPFIVNVPEVDFFCPTPDMVQALLAMIKRGQLTWHAFAFDGFNELLGETIFSAGFEFSEWLSETYGIAKVKTMSNIDVPGLYQAQLPTMIKHGVKALYVGQNFFSGWAGAIPQLPNLFRWQSPTNPDEFVITMTHKEGYGGLSPFDAIVDPVSGQALVVECVLENAPAYTPIDVQMYLKRVRRYFPNAVVVPSTFDRFVNGVMAHVGDLPIVKQDIGDTWVRAVPSDPIKTATFLAQRRDFEACVGTGHCSLDKLSTLDEVLFLMTGCEHNWGLPFQAYSWEQATLSYQEKRDFLVSAKKVREATNPLPPPSSSSSSPSLPQQHQGVPSKGPTVAPPSCAYVKFDHEAAIVELLWNGVNYADSAHRLGLLLYTEHATQGLNGTDLATGWGDPVGKFLVYNSTPALKSVSGDACHLFRAESTLAQNDTLVGNMTVFHTVQIFPQNNSVTLTLEFQNKALSYHMYSTWNARYSFGNALSVQFRPASGSGVTPPWSITSLGVEYSPSNFAANGTSHYHLADLAKFSDILSVRPLDTPLLMFGNDSASWFTDWDSPPDYDAGAWFNLFNQWNANWVVGWPWVENEGLSARYEISLLK